MYLNEDQDKHKTKKSPAGCERAHWNSSVTRLRRCAWLTDTAVAPATRRFTSANPLPFLQCEYFHSVRSFGLGVWYSTLQSLNEFLIRMASSACAFWSSHHWVHIWSAVRQCSISSFVKRKWTVPSRLNWFYFVASPLHCSRRHSCQYMLGHKIGIQQNHSLVKPIKLQNLFTISVPSLQQD